MSEKEKESFTEMRISEIQKEYSKIDANWLMLHYKTLVALVVFAFAVEVALGILLINSDMLTTTRDRFVLKFIVVPSGINFIGIAAVTAVVKSKHISQVHKIYSVSLVFVGCCFVLFTAHSTFMAMYYIFTIGIMLTVVYANYILTGITVLAGTFSLVFSELLIVWDLDKGSIFESTHRLGDFLISIAVLCAFSAVCMVIIRFERKKNRASILIELERQQLEKRLQVDEITGIFNRKALHAALKDIREHAGDAHYILAIADIDTFKDINDRWGHHLGDLCLIGFAKILKEYGADYTPFRYGGDEFCLLFRNGDMEQAEISCRGIQSKLAKLTFEGYPQVRLTASFGLAAYSEQLDGIRLFIHADHALYEAKRVRNAIRIYPGESG